MPRKQPLHRKVPLTDLGVGKLKPPTERSYENHYDAKQPGLVLRVNRKGSKVWHGVFYVGGKPGTRRLGRFPKLGVKQARKEAEKLRASPPDRRRMENEETFQSVAENFMQRYVVAEMKLRSQPQIERIFNRYIFPRWKDRPFRELRRTDVTKLMDEIADQNGKRQADMCLAVISKLTNWYQSRNDEYTSPVVRGMRRSNGTKRDRILNDDEIRAVWKACDEMGTFGAMVKVLLLSAQRRDKVGTMQWDDVVSIDRDDVKDRIWKIRKEDREKPHAGSLILPPIVLAIIDAQPRLMDNPYVFPAGHGQGPFNSYSQRKAEFDKLLPGTMPPWVLHDLRRTAKSLMSRADVRPDISERVLGHAIAGVEGVYDRHDYNDQKGEALKRLASLVEKILNPPADNVVTMQGRKQKKTAR